MRKPKPSKLLLLLALVGVGCSHEVESPPIATSTPGAGAIEPDVVCVEQLTTEVTINGSGFTPMPTKTLEDERRLELPAISLERVSELDGTAATGSVDLEDDPGNPSASRVTWVSSSQMQFRVDPELNLQPGVYNVSVTNPDEIGVSTIQKGFAAVPRPSITQTHPEPDLACVAQGAQQIKLVGTGLLQVGNTLPSVKVGPATFPADAVEGCTPIPGSFQENPLASCTSLTFTIPQDGLEVGQHDVIVVNPAPAACDSASDAISLVVVPPPMVAEIEPDLECVAQAQQDMTITGAGFLQIGDLLPTVTVGDVSFDATALEDCEPVPGTFREGEVLTCTTLRFAIPTGALDPGDHYVTVTNPAPGGCQSTQELVLHVAPPPVVTLIEPDLECVEQADQALVATGTGFLQIGSELPTVTLGSETFPATSLEECTPVSGTFSEGVVTSCTKLRFTIPQGTLEEGDYNVVVTNPIPAECSSSESVNLHIAPPPIIDDLSRLAICDDQGDQTLVITGSKFLQVGDDVPIVTIGTEEFLPEPGGCTALPQTFAAGTVLECTSLTITVPGNMFSPGEYDVVVTNPFTAECSSSEKFVLQVNAPPRVDAVVPATVCSGGSTVTVVGEGFLETPTVRFVSTQGEILATAVSMNATGTELSVGVPPGALVGETYEVIVQNPDGCEDRPLPHKTVTVVAGPIVYFVDPEVVYNGVNTRATIYATALTLPLPTDAVWIAPAGQAGPVTQLNWAPVPTKPNRVQVVIPKGQAPGDYDLYVQDSTTCAAMLPNALKVTADLTLTLSAIEPSFGWKDSETAVTIFRDTDAAAPANKPFIANPRGFLNPSNPQPTDIAIPLESVAMVDEDTLTAVVPENQPVHVYDLIVVNPDGSVGYLANAFEITELRPPEIASVTPASIVAATNQQVLVSGHSFRDSTITVTCETPTGTTIQPPVVSGTVSCTANGKCSQQAIIDGSSVPAGSVCVLTLTNSDGSYANYSAIGVTTPSLNLSNPKPGTLMNIGRRALVAPSGNATSAARFVYAIGGDNGGTTTHESVEFASVDLFGNMKDWEMSAYGLGTGRSFAASTTLGRYIYVYGGSNGSNAIATAQRAMILSPREVPELDVEDIIPDDAGLDPGYWYYRVSAVFSLTDPDNPGGESLPSDEFIVKVPSFPGKKIQVALRWVAPKDALNQPLPNVTGYRLYRTAAVNGSSGDEVLLAQVSASTFTYTDDGTATPGTERPLRLGSTGKWHALPSMNTPRKGLGGAVALDPGSDLEGLMYYHIYALLGLNDTGAATVLNSYEYLTVTVDQTGKQTVASAWTQGTSTSTQPRWQLGAWTVDSVVTSLVPAGDTWIYTGGGLTAATGGINNAPRVEAAKVNAGGQLTAWNTAPTDFVLKMAGYGVTAANGRLLTFGGIQAAPSQKAKAAVITSPVPSLAVAAWNDEGLNMTHGRYLLGSSVQSAFIFLVGGQTDEPSAASRTSELVVW